MKRKILSVNLDILLSALCRDDRGWLSTLEKMGLPTEGWEPPFFTCDGMPEDARIIDIRPNCAFSGTADLLIESDTFEDVPDGKPVPVMNVTMGRFSSYRAFLEMSEPTAKPTAGLVWDAPGKPFDRQPVAHKMKFREFI